MKRVGILGGTFDPPHFGHLLIAEEVLYACGLDEIWFMPNKIPPHKRGVHTCDHHRVEMVRCAISDNPNFHLSLIEFKRQGLSYTYDTMKVLCSMYPSTKFYFIIGADMVEYLPHWHRIDQLVSLVTFIGVKRPGYTLTSPYKDSMIEVSIPQFDVSSSLIRKRIEQGGTTRYLLPECVRIYIEEHGLYGQKRSASHCKRTVD